MPNTPALVGKGAAGMVANDAVSDKQKTLAEQILVSVGECLWGHWSLIQSLKRNKQDHYLIVLLPHQALFLLLPKGIHQLRQEFVQPMFFVYRCGCTGSKTTNIVKD
jgi:hypothetical protein